MIKATLTAGMTVLALVVTTSAGCAPAATARHLIWEVSGESNRVYLLGSVHLLRQEDYPLPPIYELVYDEAEELVMELDMDDLDFVRMQQLMISSGMVEEGQSLSSLLGEQQWRKASAMADSLDLPLDRLEATEPWFAALTVVELQMMKLGFDPSLGVEFHFLRRAQEDGKSIAGLESMEQQIAFFDHLPMETQVRFLLKALEDARSIEPGIEKLIGAWRTGDTAAMHEELTSGFEGFPAVYSALVVRRNLAWTGQIERFLDDEDDYLVIVGALHLVGDDSVVRLLEKRGYRLKQL